MIKVLLFIAAASASALPNAGVHQVIHAGLNPPPHKTEHHFEHHDLHRHISYHFDIEPADGTVDLDLVNGVESVVCTNSSLRITFATVELANRAGLRHGSLVSGKKDWGCLHLDHDMGGHRTRAILRKAVSMPERSGTAIVIETIPASPFEFFKNCNITYQSNHFTHDHTIAVVRRRRLFGFIKDAAEDVGSAAVSAVKAVGHVAEKAYEGAKHVVDGVEDAVVKIVDGVVQLVEGNLNIGPATATLAKVGGYSDMDLSQAGVTATCDQCGAEATLTTTFKLIVKDYAVQQFETSFKGSVGFNIAATYKSTEDKSWVHTTSDPIYSPKSVSTTFVAGIPWSLTFSMPFYAGTNLTLGSGMNLQAKASASGSVEYGLKVVDGGPLQFINQHAFSHSGQVVSAVAAASTAQFFIEPRLFMNIDHIGGPYVALRPALILSGTPSTGANSCEGMAFGLSAALAVAIGAKTDISLAGVSIPCSFCHMTTGGKFTTFVNKPITSVCVKLPPTETNPTAAPAVLGGPCPLNTYGSSCTPCPSGQISPGGGPYCATITEKIPQDTSGVVGPWTVGQVWSGAFRIISGGPNHGTIAPYISKTADMDLTVTAWDTSTGSLTVAVSRTAVDMGCTAQFQASGTYDPSTQSISLAPATIWYDSASDPTGSCSNLTFPLKNFMLSGSVSSDSVSFSGSIPNNGEFVTCTNANLWNQGKLQFATGGYVTDDDCQGEDCPKSAGGLGISRKKLRAKTYGVLWRTIKCKFSDDDNVAAGIGCTNLPRTLWPYGQLDVCDDCCPLGPFGDENCPDGSSGALTGPGAYAGAFTLSRANGGGPSASTATFSQSCPASTTTPPAATNDDGDQATDDGTTTPSAATNDDGDQATDDGYSQGYMAQDGREASKSVPVGSIAGGACTLVAVVAAGMAIYVRRQRAASVPSPAPSNPRTENSHVNPGVAQDIPNPVSLADPANAL
jgi:hypothetical protein